MKRKFFITFGHEYFHSFAQPKPLYMKFCGKSFSQKTFTLFIFVFYPANFLYCMRCVFQQIFSLPPIPQMHSIIGGFSTFLPPNGELMMPLEELGWNEVWEEQFIEAGISDALPGRVAFLSGTRFLLKTGDGEIDAILSGSFKHNAESTGNLPCVGDWVLVRKRSEVHPYEIVLVLPRRNKLSRKVAGKESTEQLIAANVDIVFIVTSADDDFNVPRLERYCAMIGEIDASPVIIVNKIDACDTPDLFLSNERLLALGVPVHGISAKKDVNLESVSAYLTTGVTIVLVGSSGVGKSTLINHLLGQDRQAVGERRASDSKGRHVTTSRELIVLPEGGIMIDNPGIREVQLWISSEGISRTFRDIDELGQGCRFKDCRHDREPGCAVKEAVESGALSAERFGNFQKLMREQANLELRRNAYEHRKQDKKFGKMVKLAKEITKNKGRD